MLVVYATPCPNMQRLWTTGLSTLHPGVCSGTRWQQARHDAGDCPGSSSHRPACSQSYRSSGRQASTQASASKWRIDSQSGYLRRPCLALRTGGTAAWAGSTLAPSMLHLTDGAKLQLQLARLAEPTLQGKLPPVPKQRRDPFKDPDYGGHRVGVGDQHTFQLAKWRNSAQTSSGIPAQGLQSFILPGDGTVRQEGLRDLFFRQRQIALTPRHTAGNPISLLRSCWVLSRQASL